MARKRLLAVAAIIIQETSSAPTAPLCRDKSELDALLATHQPLALMVLPRGCDMFPGTCGPLGEFWGAVARAFPGRVYRLSCADAPDACGAAMGSTTRLSRPVDSGVEPVFEFCGPACERYAGRPDPRSLVEEAARRLGGREARPGAMDAALCQLSGFAAALPDAYAAADAYAARRDALRTAASFVGQPRMVHVARLLYDQYLERWPDHPNAIAAAANAARVAGDAEAALALWDRLLALEPTNPHVIAGTAGAAAAVERGAAEA